MLSKKELRQLMAKYKFWPKKRLGQNFLVDGNISRKIIDLAGVSKDDVVLEIGAGFGELTEGLAKVVRKVYAIEADERLCRILRETLCPYKNIEIHSSNILEFDMAGLTYSNGGVMKVFFVFFVDLCVFVFLGVF